MRKTLARTCTVLTALLLAAYITSIWWGVSWVGDAGNRTVFANAFRGTFEAHWYSEALGLGPEHEGLSLESIHEVEGWPWRWWFRYRVNEVGPSIPGNTFSLSTITVPMWCPLLLTAIPAYLLSRRRPRPNHCAKCHYDRSATPNLPCPECGTPSASSVPSA